MSELTVLAALKAQIQYPLSTDFYKSVLVKRGLDGESECTADILNSVQFKGAHADCLRQLIIYPQSISEGGMSISKADRQSLMYIANMLYRQIGEEVLEERPKITCY